MTREEERILWEKVMGIRTDSRWRAASLDTEDACLADLYGELAEGCAAHAGVLRALLEQAL